jgi:hypothetical protein
VTGKIIKSFGDTPANELKNLGIDPTKLHEEAKEFRERRSKFLEDKNAEDKKELNNIEQKVSSLDQSINNLAAEIAKPDIDANEKVAKTALMDQQKDQKAQLLDRADEVKKNIKERDEKIEKVFKDLEDPTKYTKEAYEQKANSPNLRSYLNWGIIGGAIVILILIILFVKRMLDNVAHSFR